MSVGGWQKVEQMPKLETSSNCGCLPIRAVELLRRTRQQWYKGRYLKAVSYFSCIDKSVNTSVNFIAVSWLWVRWFLQRLQNSQQFISVYLGEGAFDRATVTANLFSRIFSLQLQDLCIAKQKGAWKEFLDVGELFGLSVYVDQCVWMNKWMDGS